MPFLLLPNHSLEPLGNVLIRSPFAQHGAKIMFRHAEQAGSNFTIRGHPYPIAMPAKRLADGRNNSDFTPPVIKSPAGRCFRSIVGLNWLKTEPLLQSFENFAAR